MSTQLDSLRRFVTERAAAVGHNATGQDAGAPRAIVVASGKGGVGTSTVAALLALTVAAEGRRVLLVDAADHVGSQHLLFGVEPRHALGALRGGEVTAEELLVPLGGELALVPAVDGDGRVTPTERRALMRRVAALYGEYALVVIDGGARMDGVLGACANGFERLLAITTADRVAIAATYALIKVVSERHPGVPVELLPNACDESVVMPIYEQIRIAAEQFVGRTIALCGAVPEDASLRAGVGGGLPIQDAAAGSPVAHAIRAIGLRLLAPSPAGAQAAGSSRSLHQRS